MDLPAYIDNGWEKSKDFKTAKYVGVTKEKPVGEQFEDKLWVLFADMGFPELNGVCDFEISYDFHDDDLKARVDILAVDEETVLVVLCNAASEVI